MEPGKTCAPLHRGGGNKAHPLYAHILGEKKIIAPVKCLGLELTVFSKNDYWMWTTLMAL